MNQKTIFKVLSLVGLASWADDKEQDAIIEEKVNEALAAREHGTSGSEEP